MIVLTMIFGLIMAAVLEAVLPTWTGLGYAHVPLLLGVAVYYAVYYPTVHLLIAAILAGLLQDSLGLVPLGYSAFCFTIVALLVASFREILFIHKHLSHVLVGAICAGSVTLLVYFLLRASGLLVMHFSQLMLRTMGMAILGAFSVPPVIALMFRLDHMLGNTPARET